MVVEVVRQIVVVDEHLVVDVDVTMVWQSVVQVVVLVVKHCVEVEEHRVVEVEV